MRHTHTWDMSHAHNVASLTADYVLNISLNLLFLYIRMQFYVHDFTVKLVRAHTYLVNVMHNLALWK